MMDWEQILEHYGHAIEELKVKMKGIQAQFKKESSYSPIEFITGRVKPVESIIEKANRKNILYEKVEEHIQDIAGLRIICQFVEDIYKVVEAIRTRSDFIIIDEKDYIARNKVSGYRAYHIIIKYPVEMIHGTKEILAEIQIRTLAMNFWATNEHSLNYKYKGKIPEDIKQRLRK